MWNGNHHSSHKRKSMQRPLEWAVWASIFIRHFTFPNLMRVYWGRLLRNVENMVKHFSNHEKDFMHPTKSDLNILKHGWPSLWSGSLNKQWPECTYIQDQAAPQHAPADMECTEVSMAPDNIMGFLVRALHRYGNILWSSLHLSLKLNYASWKNT